MSGSRIPRPITPAFLESAALHYLERFAASSASLRRVLLGKVDRAVVHWGGERADHAAAVEQVIARLAGLGYVDDAAYARMKGRSLSRQGKGRRAIRAALAAKGVDGDTADQALAALAEEDAAEGNGADPDLAAAIRLARRRRLGPFRPAPARQAHRN